MTTVDARSVSSDRVDQDLRRWPTVLAALIVGLIAGALIGSIYAAARPTSHTAQTALTVLPDPAVDITSQNGNDDNVPTQDATSFIQSQLVVINGHQLAQQVRAQAGLKADPAISATQVGQTYVVQISASDASQDVAVRVARVTGEVYTDLRTRQLRNEISGLLASTNQQLGAVRTSLGSARSTTTTALTPSQTALQTEYERLLAVRSSLAATNSQVARIVTVVVPAHSASTGLSAGAKDALAGALIGAILAVLALITERRIMPRIRSVGDLVALDVLVILPVQSRRAFRALRRAAFAESGETRLLAARLHAGQVGRAKPLVIVGTTPGVGTSLIATSVAASLAGRGPVLLVRQVGAPSTGPSGPAPVVASPLLAQRGDPGSDLSSRLGGADGTSAHAAGARESSQDAAAPGLRRGPSPRPSTVAGVWLLDVPARAVATGAATYRSEPQLADLVGTAYDAGWLVVVDAAPASHSDVASDLARHGAALALVAARGQSSPADVLGAIELFEADHCTVLGVVLNDAPGPVRRVLGRRLLPEIEVRAGAGGTDLTAPPEHNATDASDSSAEQPWLDGDGDRRVSRHSVLSSNR